MLVNSAQFTMFFYFALQLFVSLISCETIDNENVDINNGYDRDTEYGDDYEDDVAVSIFPDERGQCRRQRSAGKCVCW